MSFREVIILMVMITITIAKTIIMIKTTIMITIMIMIITMIALVFLFRETMQSTNHSVAGKDLFFEICYRVNVSYAEGTDNIC